MIGLKRIKYLLGQSQLLHFVTMQHIVKFMEMLMFQLPCRVMEIPYSVLGILKIIFLIVQLHYYFGHVFWMLQNTKVLNMF